MPWIDDDLRAAVEKRLRDVHGFPADYKFGRCHVNLGPKATRENIVIELADATASIARRRAAGTLIDEPPMAQQARDVRDIIADAMIAQGKTVCPKIGAAQWTCTKEECICHRKGYAK